MNSLFEVPKDMADVIQSIENESVLNLLTKLKDKGEMFNKMGGHLFSSFIADQMNEICDELWSKYGVEVKFTQPCPGRVLWLNLDELIAEYSA